MISRRSQSTGQGMAQSKPDSAVETPHQRSRHTPVNVPPAESPTRVTWWDERYSIFLLIALYTAQGLPMGLAFGSIPFLLKEGGSTYGDLAKFSLASLPYTLKLLIAPVVDSFYNHRFGRRKSWIVPVQLAIGSVTLALASHIHSWVIRGDIGRLLPTFFALIGLTATQDIAVDGWSLTMLRRENVEYASTCQSLGLSVGYFATFTIFLALSNTDFCNSYIRPFFPYLRSPGPVLDLVSTLRLVGVFYIFLTIYIALAKTETTVSVEKKSDTVYSAQASNDDSRTSFSDLSASILGVRRKIIATYADMFVAVRLPAVKSLITCLLIAKLGVSAYDNVTSLKMLELGFSKEKMASMVVFQTPFTLAGTLLAGRWVAKRSPIQVYLFGWCVRVLLSFSGPACVALLKHMGGVVTPAFYTVVLVLNVAYSFASECLMFVGIGAFFLNITASSVHVAGSYLTLLNTASNMGGIWPKPIVLWLVDLLTVRDACLLTPKELDTGHTCDIIYDGYYVLSAALIPVSGIAGIYLFHTLPRLGRLSDSAWRASR